MKRVVLRTAPAALLVAVMAVLMPRVSGQSTGQPSTKNGEWPTEKNLPPDDVAATTMMIRMLMGFSEATMKP